jgi:hypothetical protein
MNDIQVETKRSYSLVDFLNLHDFMVEQIDERVFKVIRGEELPVFLYLDEDTLHFELDLGPIKELKSETFFYQLLNHNTEIQPVSFAINSSNPEDLRLVLVESRVTSDLSSDELLSVFDAIELATDRAEEIFNSYIQ